MQSGSDGVLRRMRRRWGAQRFVDRCSLLKERIDRPAITTDVIVGFPGETDAEFAETVGVCREVGFSKIHIFPFSARRTTPAATMPDQLPKQVKQARGRELAAVEAELRNAYFASLRGTRLRVLVESPVEATPPISGAASGESRVMGTSCRYATVELESTGAAIGEFAEVIAGEARDERITAHGTVPRR
jgi:threonylcarbamoyladenosine tRNA methylthiotransferase MtaB